MAFGSYSFVHSFLLSFSKMGCVPSSADVVVKDLEFPLVEETSSSHRVWEDSSPWAGLVLSWWRRVYRARLDLAALPGVRWGSAHSPGRRHLGACLLQVAFAHLLSTCCYRAYTAKGCGVREVEPALGSSRPGWVQIVPGKLTLEWRVRAPVVAGARDMISLKGSFWARPGYWLGKKSW